MEFAKFIGLPAETAVLIESFRRSPAELEHAIIDRELRSRSPRPQPQKPVGCDLGYGVVLDQDEVIELYLQLGGMNQRSADGTAVARDGHLWVGEGRIVPRRVHGELQAAMEIIQRQLNHRSATTGDRVSLNAWRQWFRNRDGRRVSLGSLRPEGYLRRRNRG